MRFLPCYPLWAHRLDQRSNLPLAQPGHATQPMTIARPTNLAILLFAVSLLLIGLFFSTVLILCILIGPLLLDKKKK